MLYLNQEVRKMIKYENEFVVKVVSDDENYLVCKTGQIYRRTPTELVFFSETYDASIIKELKARKIKFESWLNEGTDMMIIFKEKDFKKVYRLFRAKVKL